ncbi:hypothetical protein [Kingella denitrificans]
MRDMTRAQAVVSTHSRLKAAAQTRRVLRYKLKVSTHSRLKAADFAALKLAPMRSFNTQPPEGGWLLPQNMGAFTAVSTHSRLKAAGGNPD